MIKIKDYELFLEINNIEQCITGRSLYFIKSIYKNYKFYELIDNIYIRIWYESCYNNLDNFNKLISYIKNKRKNHNENINLPEFKWEGGEYYLEEDFGFDISDNNKPLELSKIYYKLPDKFIINAPLSVWLYMIDYRWDINNQDYNQLLDFAESLPIIEEIRREIANLYKDTEQLNDKFIQDIERIAIKEI